MTVQELMDRLELIPTEDRDKNIGYVDYEYGLTSIDGISTVNSSLIWSSNKNMNKDETWYLLG